MLRYWIVAGLALLALSSRPVRAVGGEEEKAFKVEGKLTMDDPKDKKLQGSAHKVHTYKMKKGVTYIIDMSSKDLDAYLRLEDADSKQLAEDDDSGGGSRGLDARIAYEAPKDGEYRIICTSFQPEYGSYTLTVRKGSKEDIAKLNPHAYMIGKAAPNITGDACVNGSVKQLADLKGKVVLVDFWAVWCGPCIATFPHLREWSKEYGKEGLTILGVTTYYEKLGFDKEKGSLTQLKENLTPAEERAMVKDFATYHKLTHPLLLSPQQDYMQAGKEYAVRGIPTAVLIDRQGMVLIYRVGSGPQNAEALHAEIKKLLAEK